ncbi:unnamed protein product [Oppiella nova]|uniref:Uncharacterized protein n=1 Tax=Oppiella nova TaxID=334625 RepID=A0A7R9MVC9_9ACAR|nr:unnamed protein product [Oppiella nova]CAG2183920.1 unnamed protein product [Oppiella nova]
MRTPVGRTPPTCWLTIRPKCANARPGYVDRGTPVPSSTTTKTGAGRPRNTNTGPLPVRT